MRVPGTGGYSAQKARVEDAAFEERKEHASNVKADEGDATRKREVLANALKYGRKPTEMVGELQKQGVSVFHSWNTRYF